MGLEVPGRIPLLIAIALVPGVLRWWWGRRLVAQAGDPALAERMLAVAKRTGLASALALLPLIAISPRGTAWTLPLLIAGRLVGAFPSRRVLFEERWSLAGYLSFWIRLFTAGYGLWLFIALLPILVTLGGTLDWAAGALLAVVLLAWNLRTSEVTQRLLRARPLDDLALRGRFSAMAWTAGLTRVRFMRVDLRGGALANAAALPSVRDPVVIFTDALLAQLGEPEVVAICAHELAHHEYYSPARVRRMRRVNAALIVTGAAIVPAVRIAAIGAGHWLVLMWYVAFVAVAALRARDRQRHETASDLRAVALCGDGETLIRALTRLYAANRVPRRLDPEFERHASHPSLARRVRDIRRAAGLTPSVLTQDARFATPDGATIVTFQPDRVNWSEGEAASHSLSYQHLADVRVTTSPAGPPALVVLERSGRRWTMTLDGGDVARAQAVLDVVDARLAEGPPPSRVRPALSRAFAALGAALALLLGHITAGVLAMLVAVRPSPPLLAAAALGVLAAAAIVVRDQGVAGTHAVPALLLSAVAVALLIAARVTRDESPPFQRWWPLALLSLASIGALAMLRIGGTDAVSLHQTARAVSAPLVLSIALAGALLWTRRRGAIAGAAAAALAAAGVSLAGSSWFLDRFGHDLFLIRGGSTRTITVSVPPSARFDVPFYASGVRLSPSARAIAVVEGQGDEDGSTPPLMPRFHVGRLGGALHPIAADDLRFVDDSRVIVLLNTRERLELRELSIAPPNRLLWILELPPLLGPRLVLNTEDLSWRVTGWDRHDLVRREGQLGDVAFRETRWPLGAEWKGYISALAASAEHATVIESRYEVTGLQHALPIALLTPRFSVPQTQSTVRTIARDGREDVRLSRFGAQCLPEPSSVSRLVCSVFDGTDTRVVTVSANGEVNGIAALPGQFFGRDVVGRGWIVGWLRGESLALRLPTREIFRVDGAPGEWIMDVGLDDQTFGTVVYGDRGSTVRVYTPEDYRRDRGDRRDN